MTMNPILLANKKRILSIILVPEGRNTHLPELFDTAIRFPYTYGFVRDCFAL
jgi:hypothetical protein